MCCSLAWFPYQPVNRLRTGGRTPREEWIILEMTVLELLMKNSQLIDEMSGKSLSISRNQEFDSGMLKATECWDSSVIKVTLGNYEIDHVGSSLIVAEEGLRIFMPNTKLR